jgi:myo-inositol-1(or 4)-monophosphatase
MTTTYERVQTRELLDVAVHAARRAGIGLLGAYRRPPQGVEAKNGPTDLVSAADRAAEAAIAAVLAERRPGDAILGEEAIADRAGSTGLRWVVDPLDGTVNYLLGIPLWCISIACEDEAGTLAGVVFDPIRDDLFAAARDRPATLDGVRIARKQRAPLDASVMAGTVASATAAEARRHAKLDRRLFRRVGQRRALGSAALELAWTAAGRLDVCYQEQHIHPWDVDAGLLICAGAGLRVHRLAPLEADLAPRFLAAPAGLAGELLSLIGPGSGARRRAVQERSELKPERVAEQMRRRDAR